MRRAITTGIALLLVTLVAACSDDKAEREDGEITNAGPISVFELRPGDCLYPDDDTVGEVGDIKAVPCREPHTQEVFATPEYPDEGGVYPGEAVIQQFADAACLEAFGSYTGTDYLNSDLFFTYLHPSVDSWNDDDRQVVCVIVAPGEPGTEAAGEMTGSVRDTTTTTASDGSPTTTTTGGG